jgi:hypothetical protein
MLVDQLWTLVVGVPQRARMAQLTASIKFNKLAECANHRPQARPRQSQAHLVDMRSVVISKQVNRISERCDSATKGGEKAVRDVHMTRVRS